VKPVAVNTIHFVVKVSVSHAQRCIRDPDMDGSSDEGTETWAKVTSMLLLALTWGVREPGKQKEKGSRGYEVGTCWNVQRVSEKHQSRIHWALAEMNRDFCCA